MPKNDENDIYIYKKSHLVPTFPGEQEAHAGVHQVYEVLKGFACLSLSITERLSSARQCLCDRSTPSLKQVSVNLRGLLAHRQS